MRRVGLAVAAVVGLSVMRIGLLQAIGWLSALLVLGCADAPALPEGVEIVAGRNVEQMLNQCSRGAPEKGQGTWKPATADVREFEAQLSAELPRQMDKVKWLLPHERERLEKFPMAFWREYVGIVRQGRRYIYGNFGPTESFDGLGASTEGPTMVCDGGPVFFGAEYDTTSKTVTHWGFNGSLG